jgi:translation initiation factor 1
MRLFAGTPFDRPPVCERCGKLEEECECPPLPVQKVTISPRKQTVKLSLEKRRKGKLVTAISGLSADANDLATLLTRLKGACGAGGSLDGDTLEIQGDHRDRLRTLLGEIGYKVL